MKKLFFLLVVTVTFTSCEKLFFENDQASTDPQINFDYLWKTCNEKYAYFDLKQVNWDSVKTIYESRIYEGMPDDSLFQVMAAMLAELKDGHTRLISFFNQSQFSAPYQGQDNFDWRIIEDHYLFHEFYTSGPFLHKAIDGGNIGYIRFPQFTGTVRGTTLNFILDKYKDTKGLILDLRENKGGYTADAFQILGRFVDTKTLVGYSKIKTGPGHNDFSKPEPAYITPGNGIHYSKKVAVLIDRGTYSAGSVMSLMIKALPNMVLIGDTTGGGLGRPSGGQLPNGWIYTVSISQILTLDKSPEYENGIPPDIAVHMDWSDLTKDEILERAIAELR